MRQQPLEEPAQRRALRGVTPSASKFVRRVRGRFHSFHLTCRRRRRSQLSKSSKTEGVSAIASRVGGWRGAVARIDPKKLVGIILNGLPASDAAEYADAYSAAYTATAAVSENLEQEAAQAGRVERIG